MKCRLEKKTGTDERGVCAAGAVSIRKFGTFACALRCDLFSRVIKRALTNGRVFNNRYSHIHRAPRIFERNFSISGIIHRGDICAVQLRSIP